MRLRHDVIGALNLFSRTAVTFQPDEVRIVQSLADIATIAILQERSIARAEVLTSQLQGALNSRIVIEQAKGAIAQFRNVSVDDAFLLMRDHARRTKVRLGDVAHAALSDPASLPVADEQLRRSQPRPHPSSGK